ncbi:MAG: hypothetical protein QXM08_00960 [Thermofilaceae archaeon]
MYGLKAIAIFVFLVLFVLMLAVASGWQPAFVALLVSTIIAISSLFIIPVFEGSDSKLFKVYRVIAFIACLYVVGFVGYALAYRIYEYFVVERNALAGTITLGLILYIVGRFLSYMYNSE